MGREHAERDDLTHEGGKVGLEPGAKKEEKAFPLAARPWRLDELSSISLPQSGWHLKLCALTESRCIAVLGRRSL